MNAKANLKNAFALLDCVKAEEVSGHDQETKDVVIARLNTKATEFGWAAGYTERAVRFAYRYQYINAYVAGLNSWERKHLKAVLAA